MRPHVQGAHLDMVRAESVEVVSAVNGIRGQLHDNSASGMKTPAGDSRCRVNAIRGQLHDNSASGMKTPVAEG